MAHNNISSTQSIRIQKAILILIININNYMRTWFGRTVKKSDRLIYNKNATCCMTD